jgi:hypothetical protein
MTGRVTTKHTKDTKKNAAFLFVVGVDVPWTSLVAVNRRGRDLIVGRDAWCLGIPPMKWISSK